MRDQHGRAIGRPKAMRVGVDIDGVLADYAASMRSAARDLGIDVIGTDDPTVWTMIEPGWFSEAEDWKACHEVITGDVQNMSLLDSSAPAALCRLRATGHRIVIVTARVAPPGAAYVNADVQAATRAWLASHQIPHDDLAFTGEFKTGLDLDVLVDDAPHNIERHQAAGERVVSLDHAYNRCLPGERVSSLAELADLLLGRSVPGTVA